jgi:hypothetical protein
MLCIYRDKEFEQFGKRKGSLVSYNRGTHNGGDESVGNLHDFRHKSYLQNNDQEGIKRGYSDDLYLNGKKAILGSLHIGIYQDDQRQSVSYDYSKEYRYLTDAHKRKK